MYGFKPRHAQGEPVQNLADGGIVNSLTGMLGMRKRTPEEMLAADAKVQERNREAAARVAARAKPAQQAAPAEEKAVSSYAGMSAMQRREQAAGLKDGGTVGGFKPGGLIRGPGTGTSDSIQTEKRPGTFIMPADSTQAIGPEALERLGESEEMEVDDEREMDDDAEEGEESVPVRLSNGEFELPPEQVQALGEAVLTVMRDATHKAVGEGGGKMRAAAGFAPAQVFADGGTVQDPEEDRKRRIAQIPVGGTMPAPPADGSGSSEFTRNVNNGLNALGGMGVVASVPLRAGQAAKAAATGSGATALPSGIPRLTGPAQAAAAPAADFVAGMGPGATAYANTIPRIGNAPTQALPAVNAALQEGAQANALSAAVRTASGVGAGANAVASNKPATAAPAAASPRELPEWSSGQMGYGEQMRNVGSALVNAPLTAIKHLVSAPGYGFNSRGAPAAPAATNPTDARLAAGTQRTPAGFAPAIKPQVAAAPTVPQQAPVTAPVQRMAQQPQAPAFDFDNFQPAPGQGAFRNEQTGEVTRLQDGPSPTRDTRIWKEPNVLPRSDARPAAPRQDVRAPVLNPNGGVFSSMVDFTNQAGQAVQAIAANKGMRNDRKDALDQQRVGLDAASTFAKIEQGDRALGIDGRRADTAQDLAALQADELGLKREAAGFQTRAAKRLEDLQNSYQSAKTPEERAAIARQLRELQGKEQPARYKVASGGQHIDANGVPYRTPDRIFNEQTGEFADVRDAAAPAPIAAPKAGEVRNGYRFKGGNPNDQANWTKV